MSDGPYKIREHIAGRSWALSVPREIAAMVGGDRRFWCELTEEGILYRPIEEIDQRRRPSWLDIESKP